MCDFQVRSVHPYWSKSSVGGWKGSTPTACSNREGTTAIRSDVAGLRSGVLASKRGGGRGEINLGGQIDGQIMRVQKRPSPRNGKSEGAF